MLTHEGDDVDPRMADAVQQLGVRLKMFQGVHITNWDRFERRVDEITKRHRNHWKLRGLAFPEVAAVILRDVGGVEVFRADLDYVGFQRAVIAVVKKYPLVSKESVARAFTRAYPHYAQAVVSQQVLHTKQKEEIALEKKLAGEEVQDHAA